MHATTDYEKLGTFHSHCSAWFKTILGLEALGSESTKKTLTTKCSLHARHCVQCFAHTLPNPHKQHTEQVPLYFANEEIEVQGHMSSKWQTPKSLLLNSLLCYPYGAHVLVGKGEIYEPVQCEVW